MPPDEDRAELLRKHLALAGCKREALFADDAPTRAHALSTACATRASRTWPSGVTTPSASSGERVTRSSQ